MPDVTRSDSQRSGVTLKPRVSFNRDVHVKRIVPRDSQRGVGAAALAGDGDGHLVPTPVRKERLPRSKQQLAEEAARVIHQADKVDCRTKENNPNSAWFYTLPTRKKTQEYPSIDRRTRRRNSEELSALPPKKPPRTFTHGKTSPKPSLFSIFRKDKPEEPRKSNLRRSVSDASNLKSSSLGDDENNFRKRSDSDSHKDKDYIAKKQLSPIIEVVQREDYFSPHDENEKNVVDPKKAKRPSVTEQLKEYIDEVDSEIYRETGVRVSPPKHKEPEVVIIDVEKAEKISSGKKGSFREKIKSLAHKKKSKEKSSDSLNRYKDPLSEYKNFEATFKKEENSPTSQRKSEESHTEIFKGYPRKETQPDIKIQKSKSFKEQTKSLDRKDRKKETKLNKSKSFREDHLIKEKNNFKLNEKRRAERRHSDPERHKSKEELKKEEKKLKEKQKQDTLRREQREKVQKRLKEEREKEEKRLKEQREKEEKEREKEEKRLKEEAEKLEKKLKEEKKKEEKRLKEEREKEEKRIKEEREKEEKRLKEELEKEEKRLKEEKKKEEKRQKEEKKLQEDKKVKEKKSKGKEGKKGKKEKKDKQSKEDIKLKEPKKQRRRSLDEVDFISKKSDRKKSYSFSHGDLSSDFNSLKREPREEPIGEPRFENEENWKLEFIPSSPSARITEAIDSLKNQSRNSNEMIHSSQQPPDKPPLTKGRTVDSMVKRLSSDKCSPPPKTSIMITPNISVQHNNNQPFSYTRGLSPEKSFSPEEPRNPVIYAQVVCGQNGSGNGKQTVHAAYNGKKHVPHSDSDEGLGYEENFGRKYEAEKTITRFGDDYNDSRRNKEYFQDERFEEEFPITPKFKSMPFNGFDYDRNYHEYNSKAEHVFVDSSSRGRADGMDSKRRESLTEPFDSLNPTPLRQNTTLQGDLSARRDQLESRITRRFGEKNLAPQKTNVYVTETTSRYYRSGSASPVGFTEKYVSETKTDKQGEQHKTESRSRKYFGENERHRKPDYRYIENEPKSFDSQLSDYRSSTENLHRPFESSQNVSQKKPEKPTINKNRDYYKSNPEIAQGRHDYRYERKYPEAYHNSLRREETSKTQRYFDQSERKDRFGDSGIENDFRRDSNEQYRRKQFSNNDSEDEGFASSLLIASERLHTEDLARKHRNEAERNYHREDSFRNEDSDYKKYRSKERLDYAPRERSIDDGSHYDPRIDKDDRSRSNKKIEKKPPKPEKKSGLEKMKQLFSRDSKKNKKEKQEKGMVREESLRARYTEYKGGSREDLEPRMSRKDANEVHTSYDYSNRRRLSTPSPSPTRDVRTQSKPKSTRLDSHSSSWFKSLDRLSRKKSRKGDKDANFTSADEETPQKPPLKNLRFFGDTDIESNDSVRQKSSTKSRSSLTINKSDRTRSQSSRDLHNITEERRSPERDLHKSNNHKSMMNISETDREIRSSRLSLKPPMSPNHRSRNESSRTRDERHRRRKTEASPVESSTEGDSSQQSQRSVVYLHAATVGDIPGPGYLRNGRRAASREELTSNSSSRIQPQAKTLSRSFSVLAPWRPRHYKETMDIDYTQYQKPVKNGKYEQKVSKSSTARKDNSSTLKKKAAETRRSNQNMSTLTRRSRSKENISSGNQTLRRSREDSTKGSSSTLYKKKDRQPKESSRYSSNREDKKMAAAKSMSVESLRSSRRRDEVSRSTSMPRDPEKSAGWFRMGNKKSK